MKNKPCSTIVLSAAISLLLVVGCGGSSGGDANPPTGNESNSDNQTNAGNDSNSNNEQSGTTTVDSTPTQAFLNARVRALMVSSQPAPGIEGGKHGAFLAYDTNSSGDVIGYGGFIDPENASPLARAIWAGPANDLELLISTEDPESSLSASIPIGTFTTANSVSIADNGTLGMRLGVAGPDGFFNGRAYLIREPDSTLLTPVLSEGIAMPTSTGTSVLNEFLGAVKLSNAGIAFAADVNNDVRGLWTYANDTAVLVAPGGIESFEPPILPGTDCRVFYTDLPENDPFTIDDAGSILFPAILFPETADGECPQTSALVRYTAGEYEAVIIRGEVAPDYVDSIVDSISFQGIFPNGDALVGIGIVRIGSSTINPDFKNSAWRFSKSGRAPIVLSLSDESFNSDRGTEQLSSCCFFNTGANQEVTMQSSDVPFTGTLMFSGPHRSGQPYPRFSDTGPNDLSFIARTNGPAPAEFPNTHIFSSLGTAEPDGDGNYYFSGRVLDDIDGDVVREGIWKADASGTITSVVSIGDDVVVLDGSVQTIVDIQARNFNGSNTGQIFLTSSNSLIITGQTSGSALNFVPIEVRLE